MKILMIGDVTSPAAAKHLAGVLPAARRRLEADFVTVNAENAGFIIGPSPETAQMLLSSGADVLTGGNHTMQNYSMLEAIGRMPNVLRPANYPQGAPGNGYTVTKARNGMRVLVMSLLGRVHMDPPLSSPFEAADRVLNAARGRYDIALVDIHAEASGEKTALGYHLDGRAAAVCGTHTHVPTADERILPEGTAYITDLGMCGAEDGVLGMSSDDVVERYLTAINHKLHPAEGRIVCQGVLIEVSDTTGRATEIRRVTL